MKLINKDAVVAEIERRRDAALMRQQNLEAIGQETVLNEMIAFELNKIISFLNTLEVKEVDLEKEINKYISDNFFGSETIIDSMQEEPVSKNLEEAAKNHAAERFRTTRDAFLAEKCKWSFIAGAQWCLTKDK